jgi:hypothetical protein
MKKQIFVILGLAIVVIAFAMLFRFAIFSLPEGERAVGTEQGDIAQLLEERLKQLGVSVTSVKVTNQSPLEIEITLQSQGDEEHFSKVDFWDKCISRRETEFAYLNYGTHIDSYRTIILNSKGENIYDNTTYLDPDKPSQKFNPGTPSNLDLDQTKEILNQTLDVGKLKLLSLDVPPRYFDQWNSKLVTIDLSTGIDSHQAAELWVSEFIIGLKPQINAINDQNGLRVALVWVKIYDPQENLLVDYFLDIDLGTQTFWVAEDFHGGWYSEPAPVASPFPTIDTTPIPSPSPIPAGDVQTSTPKEDSRTDSGPYPTPPYP